MPRCEQTSKLTPSFKHGALTQNNLSDKLLRRYKNAGLTTKVILASLCAAIVVLSAATYFLAAHVTQTLNDNARQQLHHDVSLLRAAVAARVESANIEAVEYSKTLAERVYEAMGGEAKASQAALEALTGQNPVTAATRLLLSCGTCAVRHQFLF